MLSWDEFNNEDTAPAKAPMRYSEPAANEVQETMAVEAPQAFQDEAVFTKGEPSPAIQEMSPAQETAFPAWVMSPLPPPLSQTAT